MVEVEYYEDLNGLLLCTMSSFGSLVNGMVFIMPQSMLFLSLGSRLRISPKKQVVTLV